MKILHRVSEEDSEIHAKEVGLPSIEEEVVSPAVVASAEDLVSSEEMRPEFSFSPEVLSSSMTEALPAQRPDGRGCGTELGSMTVCALSVVPDGVQGMNVALVVEQDAGEVEAGGALSNSLGAADSGLSNSSVPVSLPPSSLFGGDAAHVVGGLMSEEGMTTSTTKEAVRPQLYDALRQPPLSPVEPVMVVGSGPEVMPGDDEGREEGGQGTDITQELLSSAPVVDGVAGVAASSSRWTGVVVVMSLIAGGAPGGPTPEMSRTYAHDV
ncbi:hypothetical protein Dimus_010623 [Dionaea muscipula]